MSNASGVLKAEMRALDSLILRCALESRVPAGGALAVDRDRFSDLITEAIKSSPLVTFETAWWTPFRMRRASLRPDR